MIPSPNLKNIDIRKYYNKEFSSLLIQHAAILLIGFGIFLLEEYEQFPEKVNLVILLLVAVVKAIYFTVENFKNIYKVRIQDKSFNHFLILTGLNILLIVISFALDYYCINKVLPGSISGLVSETDGEKFLECLYFSIVTFSTTGFGDVAPTNLYTRGLVAIEIIVAFTATIFVIANYTNYTKSIIVEIDKTKAHEGTEK